MKKKEKQAAVYKFTKKGMFLIHSISRTQGPSIATPPFTWVDIDAHFENVVSQVFIALEASRFGLPMPTDWNAFSKDFLTLAGLKKEADFYKDCLRIGIVLAGDTLVFSPMRNQGRRGFVNIVPYKEIEVKEDSGIKEISMALKEAFELCE